MPDKLTLADMMEYPEIIVKPCAEGVQILMDDHNKNVVGSSEWEIDLLTWDRLDTMKAQFKKP